MPSLLEIALISENQNALKRTRVAMLAVARTVLAEQLPASPTQQETIAHAKRQALATGMAQYPDHYASRVLMQALTVPDVAAIATDLSSNVGTMTPEDEAAMDLIVRTAAAEVFDALAILVPSPLPPQG